MRRFLKWTFIILFIAAVAGGAFWAGKGGFTKKNSGKDEKEEKPVTTAVRRGNLQSIVSQTGRLAPMETVQVKPDQNGRILEVLVKEGDEVKKDRVLAKLEVEKNTLAQFEQIRHTMVDTHRLLEEAQRKLEVARQSAEARLITEEQLKDAQATVESAESAFKSARAQVELAKRGTPMENLSAERIMALPFKKNQAEIFYVRASQSSTVMEVLLHEGESATAAASFGGGSVIMTLADLSQLIVEANINEIDVPYLAEDMQVAITFDAIRDKNFNGKIIHIAPTSVVAGTLVYYPIKVLLLDRDPRLRPGMTARIEVKTSLKTDVVWIPKAFLFYPEDKPEPRVVLYDVNFTTKEDFTPKDKAVKVGLSSDMNIEIIEGLQEGEVIQKKDEKLQTIWDRRRGHRR